MDFSGINSYFAGNTGHISHSEGPRQEVNASTHGHFEMQRQGTTADSVGQSGPFNSAGHGL